MRYEIPDQNTSHAKMCMYYILITWLLIPIYRFWHDRFAEPGPEKNKQLYPTKDAIYYSCRFTRYCIINIMILNDQIVMD